jgi:hypothetical protein
VRPLAGPVVGPGEGVEVVDTRRSSRHETSVQSLASAMKSSRKAAWAIPVSVPPSDALAASLTRPGARSSHNSRQPRPTRNAVAEDTNEPAASIRGTKRRLKPDEGSRPALTITLLRSSDEKEHAR